MTVHEPGEMGREPDTPAPGGQSRGDSAAPAAEPRRSRRGRFFFWGLISGCSLLFIAIAAAGVLIASFRDRGDIAWIGREHVAVVEVEGVIADSRDVIEDLHRYRDNDRIKAIVLRVNSPGGAIVPSQEIFEEIRRIREDHDKPVVASLDSVAASGGYYIAAPCSLIVANPGTITGSIGVIAQWFNVEELVRWAKLKPETFTTGKMKDVGSPFRPVTEEEKVFLQAMMEQLHQQFVRAVAQGRKGKLTLQEVAMLADGRVYTGEEARKLKLVDELGNLQDAIRAAGRLAGIDGEPEVLYPRPKSPGLLELLAAGESGQAMIRELVQRRAQPFLYLW